MKALVFVFSLLVTACATHTVIPVPVPVPMMGPTQPPVHMKPQPGRLPAGYGLRYAWAVR
jgi:hypothetical protein